MIGQHTQGNPVLRPRADHVVPSQLLIAAPPGDPVWGFCFLGLVGRKQNAAPLIEIDTAAPCAGNNRSGNPLSPRS